MQKQSFLSKHVAPVLFDFPAHYPVMPPWGLHTVGEEKSQLHFHNGLELGLCYEGAGVFFVDDQIVPFRKGDVSVIFEDEAHIAQSQKGNLSKWKFITLHPAGLLDSLPAGNYSRIDRLVRGPGFGAVISGESCPELVWLIRSMVQEEEHRQPSHQVQVKAYAWALVNLMLRRGYALNRQEMPREHQHWKYAAISPAVSFLSNHYDRDIRVAELAGLCLMSIPHFRRVFSEVMQCAPMTYLYRIRMTVAMGMLRNHGLGIMEVALSVGYTSVSSFNRHFHQMQGMSPSAWRKKADTAGDYASIILNAEGATP